MEPHPSIRVDSLTRRFGPVTAIKNVSFEVARGEVVGFLGPNGAGKSTAMRILAGLLNATSGAAWVGGIPVAQAPREVKRRIGYMPENNPLPPEMRVAEYLRFRARLKEVPNRQVRAAVEEAMEVCDLARTARRKIIGTLSKGFRQRVGVADALLGEPEVIVMDEPTIGLDPHQIQGMRRLINDLRGRVTLILSSHILPEIERCCDRVIIINRGRIVATGSSDALRREFLPGDRFTLEVEGSVERLFEQLARQGVGAETVESEVLDDRRLRLQIKTGENAVAAAQLVEWLAGAEGLRLHALSPARPSLEAIFLAATKRSWEETPELPGGESKHDGTAADAGSTPPARNAS